MPPQSNHACPPLWTEWQTGVKILPCPKLRLRAVNINIRKDYDFFQTGAQHMKDCGDQEQFAFTMYWCHRRLWVYRESSIQSSEPFCPLLPIMLFWSLYVCTFKWSCLHELCHHWTLQRCYTELEVEIIEAVAIWKYCVVKVSPGGS